MDRIIYKKDNIWKATSISLGSGEKSHKFFANESCQYKNKTGLGSEIFNCSKRIFEFRSALKTRYSIRNKQYCLFQKELRP